MGGIIVIDFIDMQTQENRQVLFEQIKEYMQKDRTKHNILPLSKFGLMQITRQRVRPEMDIKTDEVCPTCSGTGKVEPSILFIDQLTNAIKYIHRFNKTRLTLKTHPFVASYINKGFISLKIKWWFKFKCLVKVVPDTRYTFLEFHFFDTNNEEIML